MIEDDFLIAMDFKQLIENAGGTVIGPASSRASALWLTDSEEFDVALLDVQLADGFADPIARELQARHIPFVVVTGYEHGTLPPGLQEAPYMQKPIVRDQLLIAIEGCVALSRQQRLKAEDAES